MKYEAHFQFLFRANLPQGAEKEKFNLKQDSRIVNALGCPRCLPAGNTEERSVIGGKKLRLFYGGGG